MDRFAFSQSREDNLSLKFQLLDGDRPLSFAAAIRHWQQCSEFREFFTRMLGTAPFAAFLWESPPLTRGSIDQPFESVLIDCPLLAGAAPDLLTFASHFQSAAIADSIVSFPNLGQDAQLLAPCPVGHSTAYTHLAAFVRNAPQQQIHALWRNLGRELDNRLSDRPTWMSSNGLGVHWLHLRLDSRPKYYHHVPYRNWPGK